MFSGRDDDKKSLRHLPRGLMEVAREQLADRAFQHYLDWRDETSTLERAYDRWVRAPRGERAFAFAAYRAALDREEHAAVRYEAAMSESERLLSGGAAAA
jgi:hypothetical protein